MTTNLQLQEWLTQWPDDARIQIAIVQEGEECEEGFLELHASDLYDGHSYSSKIIELCVRLKDE
jgi:hypothetical protein